MEKAEKYGSGWVSVCNSNHFGIAGYYPLQALKRDLIGWAMTNSTKLVAPLCGSERMLGTNPIAIAFPGHEESPIVIDMATSVVGYGKIEIALREHKGLPKGWIVDRQGRATTNPEDMIAGGAQLPLGSERALGGHEGYCLAAMVDTLSCVLSGANWGPSHRPSRSVWRPPRAASAKASATSSARFASTASSTWTSSSGRSMTGSAFCVPPAPPPEPPAR